MYAVAKLGRSSKAIFTLYSCAGSPASRWPLGACRLGGRCAACSRISAYNSRPVSRRPAGALRAALLQALADAATRFEPDSNVTPKSAGFKRVMTIIRDLQRWGTYIPAVTGASRNLLSTMVSAQRHEGAFLTRLFDYQHTYVVSCC